MYHKICSVFGLISLLTYLCQPLAQAATANTPWQPLLAWSIAPDGAVFVLDGRHQLFELDPDTLAPLRHSETLLTPPLIASSAAYLLTTEDALWVGSRQLGQTLLLDRDDFSLRAKVDHVGPLALIPDKQLFVIQGTALWAYALSDLDAPPEPLIAPWTTNQFSGDIPQTLQVDPEGERLYVTVYGQYGSSPHNRERLRIYTFVTQSWSDSEAFLGSLLRPVVASEQVMTLHNAKNGLSGSTLLLLDTTGKVEKEYARLDAQALAASQDGERIYLARDRGLWALDGHSGALINIIPFQTGAPRSVLLSPDEDKLYLFGNGWSTVIETDLLSNLSQPAVAPFPTTWLKTGYGGVGLYRSPQFTRDGVAFLLADGELHRSQDHGRSWRFLPMFTYPDYRPLDSLSLSPDFAQDQTVVARSTWADSLFRSTDGGHSWQPWQPLIAFTSARDGNHEIYAAKVDGSAARRLTNNPANDETPAWSPGWTRLVFASNRTGNWDLFSVRADCDPATPAGMRVCDLQQLTNDPADDLLPAWSPDGGAIAFVSMRDGNPEIYQMEANGANPKRLTYHPNGDWRPAWRPTGQLLFASDRAGNNDIYQLNPKEASTGREPTITPIIATAADERDPAMNSHGDLLFVSNQDDIWRVYQVYAWALEKPGEPVDPYQWQDLRSQSHGGHPTWVEYGSRSEVLLAVDEATGNVAIYAAGTLGNAATYHRLEDSFQFDGHPAGGPVFWRSPERP